MKLNSDVNYIVSGLERSGTSMLMQILEASGTPMAIDTKSRPPDDNNPKGYFELEGGKIKWMRIFLFPTIGENLLR